MRDLCLVDERGEPSELARERGISSVVADSLRKTRAGEDLIKSALVVGEDPLFSESDQTKLHRIGVYLQNGDPEQGIVVYGRYVSSEGHSSHDAESAEILRRILTQSPGALLAILQSQAPGSTTYDSIAQFFSRHDNPFWEDTGVKASLCLRTLMLAEGNPGFAVVPNNRYKPEGDLPRRKRYAPMPQSVFLTLYADTREGRAAYEHDTAECTLPISYRLKPGYQVRSGERLCDLSMLYGVPLRDSLNQTGHVFYWGLTEGQQARIGFVPEADPSAFRAAAAYVARQYHKVDSKLIGENNSERRNRVKEIIARSAVRELAGR